jgi:DegV family protein with EDD domain
MITIITDTTSSLTTKRANDLNIPYLPQIIIFGQDSYRDDTEIDTATFLKKLREFPTLPKTAAPPPALYTPIYKEEIEKGNSIIVITPSSEVSGTARSATVAAEEFPGADIRIIDTRSIAAGLGSVVLQSLEWVKQGLDVDTVEAKIRDMASRERLFFIVDTLEYLQKGGRIGGAAALVGSLLQVKPILTIRNGRAEAVESQRTKKRAIARIKEIVENECPRSDDAWLSVSHCDAEDEAIALANDLKEMTGIQNIPIYELPPAIVVHAGPKVLEVSYFVKHV